MRRRVANQLRPVQGAFVWFNDEDIARMQAERELRRPRLHRGSIRRSRLRCLTNEGYPTMAVFYGPNGEHFHATYQEVYELGSRQRYKIPGLPYPCTEKPCTRKKVKAYA